MSRSVSIITTCKNRLDHLLESLPSWLNQNYTGTIEIIVVDYQCPQNTTQVVQDRFRGVDVRCVTATHPKGLFNPAHARNVGSFYALGEVLAFMDADTVLGPNEIEQGVRLMETSKTDLVAYREGPIIFGSCYINAGRFHANRGYDESIADVGYGFEDIDLYFRLRDQGVPLVTIESPTLRRITHTDEKRYEFFPMKSMRSIQKNVHNCRDTSRTVNPLGYGLPVYGQYPSQESTPQ